MRLVGVEEFLSTDHSRGVETIFLHFHFAAVKAIMYLIYAGVLLE